MTIALSTIQSTWGGTSAPINLSSYYQGGSIIGLNVRGGSIPTSGAINEGAFVGALNQYNWGNSSYINGDQSNDGLGYCMCYYKNPVNGQYCLTFVFGGYSASFSVDSNQLIYATGSSNLSSWSNVYAIPLTTVGTTVYGTSGNAIKNNASWLGNFPGGWQVRATLNSGNTVTLEYNPNGSSGDSGTAYALARQRDAWNVMFGSYTKSFSVPTS